MLLRRVMPLEQGSMPLNLVDIPMPEPQPGEVRLKVSVCGVCHTELDEIEGRTAPPTLPVVLGHEVVGHVEKLGGGANKFKVGDRVGVGWIHSSTGELDENLSSHFKATGRDVNGGYAQYMTVPEGYAYPIPATFSDTAAAPLLCAGAVGYRTLKLTGLQDGEALGLMGFGGSAHLVLQMVRHAYPRTKIYVFARDERARKFARELGAIWVGDIEVRAPERLHAIIDTTPAWKPVVEALANLRPGGRLVINAIRKEDADKNSLLDISYHQHLWLEKEVKSVANVTHYDLEEFLPLAAEIPIEPAVESYPLERANEALMELKRGQIRGAKVLLVN